MNKRRRANDIAKTSQVVLCKCWQTLLPRLLINFLLVVSQICFNEIQQVVLTSCKKMMTQDSVFCMPDTKGDYPNHLHWTTYISGDVLDFGS